jgi:hypothetical protein
MILDVLVSTEDKGEGGIRRILQTAAAPVRASWRQFQVVRASSRDIAALRRKAGRKREEESVRRKEKPPARS